MKYIATLLAGLLLGWLLFRGSANTQNSAHAAEHSYWTCSMDPQIKQDKPGRCPICGMDLIEAKPGQIIESDIDPDAVMLSEEALALAGVETAVVGTGNTAHEVTLYGKIQADERTMQAQSAYVGGRIERLMISALGDEVRKGQPLAVLYSPDLYAAEQELASALKMPQSVRPALVEAARERLRLLNVSEERVRELLEGRAPSAHTTLRANTSGTLVQRNASQGDYVAQGEALMQVAQLGRVWAMFRAYEADLPYLRVGQEVQFRAEALPGEEFTGRITLIEPLIDAESRTAGVRLELSNAKGQFKPEMLLTGSVAATLSQYAEEVIVPKSAVLWTGPRSVVYVKDEVDGLPIFQLRQVDLGPSLPEGYIILNGLAEGEEIVVQGAFAIDASAQLEGKKSMLSSEF